ncbi:putative hydroxyindole O-methyltransferase [Sporormia fimetaria CBS 119925]|uniref:Hydroxyindole O-methyltransferase n=1 Tax=Sporormia fimetaria CBS 119925 TaxID=1340428 RepID=A0A6A6VR27_9PLEO|nr:putative hydroxyindole O-methyltransferase [Sporormia fimetaria CBS 119925]
MASKQQISDVIERIVSASKRYGQDEPGSREDLMDLGRELVMSLENPTDFLIRLSWGEMGLAAMCKVGVQTNLFQHIKEASPTGITPSSLAQKTNLDLSLLARFLRHMASMHLITITSGKIHGTHISHALASKQYQQALSFTYDLACTTSHSLPAHLQLTNYTPSTSLTSTAFQTALNTSLPFFDHLVANPPHLDNFDAMMTISRASSPKWYDSGFYPVHERLIADFDPTISDNLLVDIGGGRGHDVRGFKSRHPDHPGKLVLQDREPVVRALLESHTSTKEELGFSAQIHDFFTEQPIQHARAYHFHWILHDWNDDACVEILKRLIPALKRGYSRILLSEIVVDEERPRVEHTAMDLCMLGFFNVRERTEREWRGIVERAGLRVTGIWSWAGVAESVVEVGLV